ncbi:MAG: helix-turn-helix domain-containing protein, partial [Chloroflexota bacterium]|nr:helix-turn-helix domain-containing protein [Chloroflexota bacterium]
MGSGSGPAKRYPPLVQSKASERFPHLMIVPELCTLFRMPVLAVLLLELCADFGEATPHGQRVKFHLTQADLARMINVSRETTNRVLAEFAHAGWVTRDNGRLLIQDQQALTAVAAEKHE